MGGQPGHMMLRGRLRTMTGRRGPKTTWGSPFPIRPP